MIADQLKMETKIVVACYLIVILAEHGITEELKSRLLGFPTESGLKTAEQVYNWNNNWNWISEDSEFN